MSGKRVIKYALIGVTMVALVVSAGTLKAKNKSSTLTPKQQLGKELFFDKISEPSRMSCAVCHGPEVGWTGPVAGINRHGAVYRGAVPKRFGNRKPPSAAYATVSPVLFYDNVEGLFIGGNFWNGRATGWELGNPSADQAQGPFLNPVEQNKPSEQSVCEHVAGAKYATLFEEVWGPGSLDCSNSEVSVTYDQIALSIADYEDSEEVNVFSSKYDAWRAGDAALTAQEMRGFDLFNGQA